MSCVDSAIVTGVGFGTQSVEILTAVRNMKKNSITSMQDPDQVFEKKVGSISSMNNKIQTPSKIKLFSQYLLTKVMI